MILANVLLAKFKTLKYSISNNFSKIQLTILNKVNEFHLRKKVRSHVKRWNK